MAVLDTGDLVIPEQILTPWLGKIQGGSTIATLSGQTPMKFGTGSTMTFDIGEAEYVGEGANKGPSTIVPTIKTVTPYKFHKTVRWTDEVVYADEDHQLGVVSQILDLIQPSLSRALDFGVFHGINPTSGEAVVAMSEFLSETTNSVDVDSDDPIASIDEADVAVLTDSYVPSHLALDPAFAALFVGERTADGVKKFPNVPLLTAPAQMFEGHMSSTSRTVGALGVADTPTGVLAFVGDFTGIRWGVQRQIGLELIQYGDPDGQGDLKRNNQVAFRAEVIYGWGIADLDAFAVLVESGS